MTDDFLGNRRIWFTGSRVGKFAANHQAHAAHIANDGEAALDFRQPVEQLLTADGGIVHEFFFLENLNGGGRGGATHCIATIGAAVGAGLPLVHDFPRGGNAGDGEAAAQPFRHDHNVRLDIRRFVRKEATGAPKTALHLINDQHNAMLVTNASQPLQEGRRRRNVAAFAQDWFDHHCRRLFRRGLGIKQMFKLAQGPGNSLFFAHFEAISIREGRDKDAARQGLIVNPVDRLGSGHRHRLCRAPMKTALEDDNVGPLGGMARQLHRRFGRLSAGIGKEEGVEMSRRHFVEGVT